MGHPFDPIRVGPGVSFFKVETERAMAACRGDLAMNPDNPRLQCHLARAIVYHADTHGNPEAEGMVYLARSSAAGQTQTMFVFGLMLSRELLAC